MTHTIGQTRAAAVTSELLQTSAAGLLADKLMASENLLAAVMPQPNRDLFRLACRPACGNAALIVGVAVADSFKRAQATKTIASSQEQFVVSNVLQWADWLQDATVDAFAGEVRKALEATGVEFEHFDACTPYFENCINLVNMLKKNEREAVKDLIQQDPACVIFWLQLQAQLACALACMLGLPNAEIWPFPRKMYAGLVKHGMLFELPTHNVRPCWTYPHNQKKPG